MARPGKVESTPANSMSYPRTISLPDGRRMTLRLLESSDGDRILSFARALPPDDLLFLRTDITEAATIDEWIQNVARGNAITVLAELPPSGEHEAKLAGYATLHFDPARWTRRVGEIRVQVAPAFRGAGLGRHLTAEIFQLGQSRGIKKMAAMMTPDQTGARAAFEKLGFQVEALLQDWVVDRGGRPRDLLIMSYDLEALGNRVSASG
ncbi:MAG TPA: GNAT family N-acetyltransferase [Candidatus Binataceae bacterium]|nr:GNAT family N-acetyltransferase [Candidatus Binataceae bacterium]